MSAPESRAAEGWVEAYLERREAGERREFERFLADEVPPDLHPEALRVYAGVREVLGALAPLPQAQDQGWRYVRRGSLGRGGNAEVVAVFDERLERELAMKLVRSDSDGELQGRRRRTRFVAEAKLAGRLEHPGVLAVHDLGRTPDGQDYFTMPKLEGHTLLELIDPLHSGKGDPPARDIARLLEVLIRVSEAVAFAHSRGVVHRDIKPANIMVGRFGETYLLDWGLAVEQGSGGHFEEEPEFGQAVERRGPLADAALTGDGDVLGTPAYMAPEQASGGARSVDRRADVYALGACLHEVLTGAPPYGRGLDALETLRRLRSGPPDLAAAQREVPAELAAIVRRALERDMEARYATAEEFAEDLRAFTEGRVVRAYESGGLAELRKWIGRNRGLSAALLAALLAVTGGIVGALSIRAEERAQSLRFLDLQLVQEARDALEPLWSPDVGRVDRLKGWLSDAETLGARLTLHRAELDLLDRRAGELRERTAPWGEWTFADRDLRWRHENLSELVRELERFTSAGGSLDVVRRGLERLDTTWPAALGENGAAWSQAREVAAGDLPYGGLELPTLAGLVPLGTNPRSGLLEFAVLGSGSLPEPGAEPRDGDALVLVLIPGGSTVVGRAASEPEWSSFELVGQEVRLDSFLLGKREVSRYQWARLVHAAEPSRQGALPRTGLSASDALAVLARWDLELPTEAQWERAAELSLAQVAPELRADVEWARAQLGPLRSAPELQPDALGLYQLLGNLAEFCADPLIADPRFADGRGEARGAPEATFETHGVIKGGHYLLSGFGQPERLPGFVRPEARLTARRDEPSERHGVRVCRNLPATR